MAILQLTHDPILTSNAQVLVLPVNTAGTLLDPVLTRTKTLYPDNYQRYHRACRDSSLLVGSCLLHKRQRESAGLGASSNGNQPSYIANLVISDHPYHPTREQWLTAALLDLQQQLLPLIRYRGIRKIALLTRPLIFNNPQDSEAKNPPNAVPLDWHSETLPLFIRHLQVLPKVRIDLHLPKNIALEANQTLN
ncbi:hypothetical protein ES754_07345 [Psychrobacter frigidicola]|uniref:Uncharacterized protein n=1 Tax=Psychrobacter frigidicola TaxID=45611 RepID=A0A5C7A1U5_9GAMM|nr:hypothetical protein [Psychrobacter frigidicola]TXD96845.1 hypothetical protein ES754_07345 [Psychrobacter frigidicola]